MGRRRIWSSKSKVVFSWWRVQEEEVWEFSAPVSQISRAVPLLVVCPLLLCREASFPLAVCLQAKPGRWFSLRLHIFVSILDFFFFSRWEHWAQVSEVAKQEPQQVGGRRRIRWCSSDPGAPQCQLCCQQLTRDLAPHAHELMLFQSSPRNRSELRLRKLESLVWGLPIKNWQAWHLALFWLMIHGCFSLLVSSHSIFVPWYMIETLY